MGKQQDRGVSAEADRATAVEPQSVSPLRDGIADAEERLRNAAPDLLAALKGLYADCQRRTAMYGGGAIGGSTRQMTAAASAIAKAEPPQ